MPTPPEKSTLPPLIVRIHFGANYRLGPDKIILLETVGDRGSIAEACRKLDISYVGGWRIIRDIDRLFGRATVVRHKGGDEGGGADLTAFGNELVGRYRNIERKVAAAARAELHALMAEMSRGRKCSR